MQSLFLLVFDWCVVRRAVNLLALVWPRAANTQLCFARSALSWRSDRFESSRTCAHGVRLPNGQRNHLNATIRLSVPMSVEGRRCHHCAQRFSILWRSCCMRALHLKASKIHDRRWALQDFRQDSNRLADRDEQSPTRRMGFLFASLHACVGPGSEDRLVDSVLHRSVPRTNKPFAAPDHRSP